MPTRRDDDTGVAHRWRMAAVAALLVVVTAHAQPPAERRAEIAHLVRQDCGSCHGLRLRGGLGPALTPRALQGRASAGLEATIKHGRPGTAMPPWEPFLTDDEIRWVVESLRQGRFLQDR
ncbi:c-type cytochrome [Arhodomonas sp. AD133]|uniref:c-type cytochrome n=1 Tax=Arhodomonas sp. AD133 TaxID=3415009 RepID=UPI003EBDC341